MQTARTCQILLNIKLWNLAPTITRLTYPVPTRAESPQEYWLS
jgi:hypothetical protein